MPAFDPVRDAVLNSPLSPSPILPPRAHPAHTDSVPVHRRATDLSVLLNTAAPHPPPPPPPLPSSATYLPPRSSAHSLSRPSTSDDTPHRTPLSPHMPPPPRPAPSQAPTPPHRRTPAGSVLVPLTHDEIDMYRSYVGAGTRRLAKRKRAAPGSENSPAPGSGPGRAADAPQHHPHPDADGTDALDADPAADAPRAKRSRDVALVADHYNARPEVGVQQRRESPIIGLRKFNNWVKSVLITRFAHPALHAPAPAPGATSAGAGGNGGGGGGGGGTFAFGGRANAKVLDMGCGKGGDLSKWSKARVKEYVGVDIAAVSVDQARARYESMTSRPSRGPRGSHGNASASASANGGFAAFFAACDCFADALTRAVPPERLSTPFDAVSLQFCMHYAFESREKARRMLDNAARWLRPGGVFVGTIPNAEQLLARLDALPPGAPPSFGNDVYRIRFEDGERARDKAARPVFGHKYWFFLRDAVEDVPEYIVHWEPFVELAAEYGLHPVYKKEFHEVFEEHQGHAEFGPLLERMKVVDKDGESQMDEDQWEAANIYIAFALEKR
ncbi:hypothetical protein HETIRDRAFT_311168 [Heterobasidion irregulare TC 32-1]|uniref:mRNA cap guanine-N(7) methyltransferase n=1 Tax=Heterobasidion irregulare (strain TC 32-1) TaxID=747525 RepID=W4KHX0_HETIT|nr:uncharacterized protein HETIRDRAFT_311168 [Heterobasidion irregulare TC 32-1]ETW85458.1 hypothetical protein HETIRDRAFT_311168 [Heterobasidion irregulare TC 32-1]